jgi:hypothetical protein
MVTRVYPEDILARHRGEPGEPDIDRAFEPVEFPRKPAADASLPEPGGDEAPLNLADGEPPGEPEPPPRPAVEYLEPTPIVFPLRFPVRIDGAEVRALTIHPPTLWDIQDWAAGRLRTNYELMARMVGLDPVALGALRWPDVEALAGITTALLPDPIREAIEKTKAD